MQTADTTPYLYTNIIDPIAALAPTYGYYYPESMRNQVEEIFNNLGTIFYNQNMRFIAKHARSPYTYPRFFWH